jgi:hypothetical protein
MVTKALANNTLNAITGHGGLDRFPGNSQTEAGKTQTIGPGENRKATIPGFFWPFEDVAKIGLANQPGAPLEARSTGH